MRIIHLSDIHLSKDNLKDFQQFYLKALIDDLKSLHEAEKIDLIIITGDLNDKGGQSFIKDKQDPYEEFNSIFIDPIIGALGLSYNNVYICPGNHDVDESKIDEIIEGGLLSTNNTIEKINGFLDNYKHNHHSGLDRIVSFKEYEKKLNQLRDNVIHEETNFESNYVLSIENLNVGISCINSAWRCSTKLSKDSLTIGTRQLLNANDFNSTNQTELNILLLHHPLEYISTIERYEIENLLQSLNFNILLSGHTHAGQAYGFHGPKGRIFVNVAKSAFSNPREKIDTFKPGYSVIDIFKSENKFQISMNFRKYIHQRVKFDKDVDIAEDGAFSCFIPTNNNTDEIYNLVKLSTNTYKSKLDTINTSLLIYGTDSIAPRDINELFVLPNITDSAGKYGGLKQGNAKDEKLYHLDEIILLDRNILIIGDKESGKSTLLNKIFIETASFFSRYGRIPVKINYSDLIKKEIKPLIKDFLNEPDSNEIEKFINNGIILLIIDEYDSDHRYIYANNKLKTFIREFPNNKIILSTSIQLEDLITEEESIFGQKESDLKHTEFKPLFLGSVGVKQFKDLSSKWFKRKDTEWLQINLEKLIKVFEILKTPRTFFSISLFLWIIEKQESFRPINKANLVNRFLLLILKGLRAEESEAGKYTFEKKIELLMEVALEMYNNGEPLDEYCLPKENIIACIKKNFTLNQLKLDESDKYQEFFDKGIFKKVNGSGNIAFRYEAFFQYFLSKNIEKSSDFKKLVYSDEHFLSFVDELDYHTGSSRDDVKTLNFVFEKLNDSFEKIDEIMTGNLDQYFPKTAFYVTKKESDSLLSEAKQAKMNDSEIESSLGEQLEMLPVQDSIKVKESLDSKKNFHKVLELAARILKNSENIQNPELINKYLDVVIDRSAKFGIFVQAIILNNIEKHKNEIPFPAEALIVLAPIINQDMLLKWLGTDFLELPIENKVKNYLKSKKGDFSEYELFLTLFVYFDLKLGEYLQYVEKAAEKIENLYIAELFYIKVVHHYAMRSNKSSLLPKLESIMVVLLTKLRNTSKKTAEKQIESLRKDKEENDLEF